MSLEKKSVPGVLLQTIKNYIDKHISILSTSLNNKNKTKRYKVKKGETSLSTGIAFITNESLITFDRIVGNPATSVNNIGVDGDYFVEDGGLIKFNPFNKDIIISVGVNYGTHDISQADILGQNTTENDISVMKHELDMLSGSGIGHNGIYYIQDVGSKESGKIYLDKTQEGVWKCLNTTTSINNTSDFERIDTTTLDDKLRNLFDFDECIINVEGMSHVRVTKHGRICTLHIDTGRYMCERYDPIISTILFNVPHPFRPARQINMFTICTYNGTSSHPSYPLVLSADGNVSVYGPIPKTNTMSAYYGVVTYLLD